jgi:hypothetical protein
MTVTRTTGSALSADQLETPVLRVSWLKVVKSGE